MIDRPAPADNAAPDHAPAVAVLVTSVGSKVFLSPFFDHCDGMMLIDTACGSREYRPHGPPGDVSMCDLIIATGPRTLICGFVSAPDRRKLQGAGIDVRLGSCASSIDDLVADMSGLSEA